jgi:hypothetical protein
VDETRPPADWDAEAAEVIQKLASACGIAATAPRTEGSPGGTVMAHNSHRGWYTALLWNPKTVTLVPGSYRPYGAPDFWHGCTTARFDLGAGEPLLVAAYHADPFRRTGGVKPGVIVGDFNAPLAAKIDDDGYRGRRYYDVEPYLEQDHDDLEFQVQAGTIGGRQLADRRQTEVLLRRGYMVDAAAHLGAPWQPTVGHWPDGQGDPDPWGPRRIDLILASRPIAPALVSFHTHTSAAADEAADHRPIVVELDPAQISREFGISDGVSGANS